MKIRSRFATKKEVENLKILKLRGGCNSWELENSFYVVLEYWDPPLDREMLGRWILIEMAE